MPNSLTTIFSKIPDLDTKSTQFLVKALEKNNLPGFDYIEFKQSMQALVNMHMDEPTAIRSAFATASTMGLTKEKLVETADYYKKVLQKEKGQFDSALKNQLQERVTSKEADVKNWVAQIERLKTQVKTLQEKIDASGGQIDAAKAKIEETNISFAKTFEAILNSINSDIDNFKTYL